MPESKKKVINSKKIILRVLFFVAYLIIILYLVYLLINFGANPLIIFFLLLFTFLITIGPFYKRTKGSLYSRMFPDRKRKKSVDGKQKHKTFKDKKRIKETDPKIFKKISLEFNYRKPIVSKCENCGNIVPNFVKKCPFCHKQITY